MNRLIIATLITLLASQAFAADAPKPVKTGTPEGSSVQQGGKTIEASLADANKAYFDKAAKEEGAIKIGSGLIYKPLKEGSGATPGVLSYVKVRARGTLINGKEFYNSYNRKDPAQHRMNRVFRCWQDGLRKMKVGGKAKLVCMPELAFKGNGAGNLVPPGSIVTYEIDLLEVSK